MLTRISTRKEYAGLLSDARWRSFESFLADMGERPEGTTLDRIDGSKGYCKANCRWATHEEQQNNRSNNKLSVEQRKELKAEYLAGGISQRKLAKKWGVSQTTVFDIISGRKRRKL